jgi:hypothetical protein
MNFWFLWVFDGKLGLCLLLSDFSKIVYHPLSRDLESISEERFGIHGEYMSHPD